MEDVKIIRLNSNPSSLIKVGLTIRATVILMPGLIILLFAIDNFSRSPIVAIILSIIGLSLCYIFFRILNRAFFKEFLTLTKHDVTITQKDLTNEKKFVF